MKKIVLGLIVILFTLSTLAQEKSAESFYNDGVSKMSIEVLSTNVINEAIIDFRKAIELNKDFKKAHLELGLALYKKSLPILSKVIDEKVESRIRANLTLPLSKLWMESIKCLEKSGDLRRKNHDAIDALLMMYKFLGMDEKYLEIKKVYDSLNVPMIINRT